MNKRWMIFLLVTVLLLSLFALGCSAAESVPVSATASPGETLSHTDREVPVVGDSSEDETAVLRFYSDMPNVAYIGLDEYYRLMLDASLSVEISDRGTHIFTTPDGHSAEIDTQTDTLYARDYFAFTNTMSLIQEDMAPVYMDGAPFCRFESVEYDQAPAPVTFDFRRYGIDLRADAQEVYFPLHTLTNLFTNIPMHYAAFNGETLYVKNGSAFANDPALSDAEYYTPFLQQKQRPADMIEYAYGHLCFSLDHFFGSPGRAELDSDLVELGLDAALEQTPERQQVKTLLLSADPVEYLVGMIFLNDMLADGGHTALPGMAIFQQRPDLLDRAETLCGPLTEGKYFTDYYAQVTKYAHISAARTVLPEEGTYHKQGDTVLYCLEDFVSIDCAAWDAFYRQEGPLPGETDLYVGLIRALERASADPEVKNFVLDVSTNPGGSAEIVTALMNLINGRDDCLYENVLTNQTVRVHYDYDANLNGMFDEADDSVRFDDLNYAVLTSEISFSCGNLFPTMMRDNGYLILGEQSGGGSCAIQRLITGDGLIGQISSAQCRLLNEAQTEIDGGVPVHVELAQYDRYTNADGDEVVTPDYSEFYNFHRLSREIHTFYAAEALTPAA